MGGLYVKTGKSNHIVGSIRSLDRYDRIKSWLDNQRVRVHKHIKVIDDPKYKKAQKRYYGLVENSWEFYKEKYPEPELNIDDYQA